MDDLSFLGMMFRLKVVMLIMATVLMFQSCFLPGIDHISHCLRYVSPSRPVVPLTNEYQHGLYNLIQGIAVQYPAGSTRDQYVAAATNFRIPYWDWAMANQPGGSVLPDSVGGSPSVTVDGPYGTQTIGNPLFSYRFDPLSSSDFPDSPVCCTLLMDNINTDSK